METKTKTYEALKLAISNAKAARAGLSVEAPSELVEYRDDKLALAQAIYERTVCQQAARSGLIHPDRMNANNKEITMWTGRIETLSCLVEHAERNGGVFTDSGEFIYV